MLRFSSGNTFRLSSSDASAWPADSLAITNATATYRPGDDFVLFVTRAEGLWSLKWSPTPDPEDPRAVPLPAVSWTLDGEGNGSILTNAVRGNVRYGEAGYAIITTGEDVASISRVMQAEDGLAWINLAGVVPQWAAGVAVTQGDYAWNPAAGLVGRLYQAASSGTTGGLVPSHAEGVETDGGVDWTYISAYTRIQAEPDVQDGDQAAFYDVDGGTIAGITLHPAGTWDQDAGISGMTAIAHDGTEWGAAGLQTIEDWSAIRGVRVRLANQAEWQGDVSGLLASWWDGTAPIGAPVFQEAGVSTDPDGWLELDLDAHTNLEIGAHGWLNLYRLDNADHRDSLTFSGQLEVVSIA